MNWKDIKGYENYEVSDTGLVRNKKHDTILLGHVNQDGYLRIKLTKSNGKTKNIFAHRLVAEAFLKKPDHKCEVNHIDENKLNNNIENLEWCDHTKNMRHSCDKKVICLNDRVLYPSARDAANAYQLHPMSVREVARGRRNSVHGWRFEYVG